MNDTRDTDGGLLPPRFAQWFADRGWTVRSHQRALLELGASGCPALLIAPTGAGKTLAGFLPSLVALTARGSAPSALPNRPVPLPGLGPLPKPARRGIHTLYISPLKALAVDIARNLERPVAEMGLDIRIETRTGDTPAHKRQRQKIAPPDILLTTPEQLALMIAARDAAEVFADLEAIVLDELHALVTSKRGDLLALGLQRLRRLAPGVRMTGLSATVAEPEALARWLVAQPAAGQPPAEAAIVTAPGGTPPQISLLDSAGEVPWAGHSARYALADIYRLIAANRTTLVFVNTRSQAEAVFHALWTINEGNLPIALHHGSLDREQRRRVEAAMAGNRLKAVVCTSTLDLGIDWGDVDLVIHVGAPKGASRLAQRIGRANHRLDEPSRAVLVPANCFEVLECQAALDANYVGAQDNATPGPGALDVLAQHVLGMAVSGPFHADDLYAEITGALPYRGLSRERFDKVLAFVATGGYALRAYEQFAKIRRGIDGRWRISHPRIAQQYRLNIGTIIEAPLMKVRLTARRKSGLASYGGRVLGEIEEFFIEHLVPGDTFLFGGEILRLEGVRDQEALVTRATGEKPKVPAYAGGRFPLSTYLASEVRAILASPARIARLPAQVRNWLQAQAERSLLPQADQLLIETFPEGARFHLVAYPFEGRLAHQTLGMLLTRRLERAGAHPLGFVASDYALGLWCLNDPAAMIADGTLSLADLFSEDMLGDDLEAWLDESYLLKRSFRGCALISGLIDRRHPGQEKTGRQVTISTDLIYDVLRTHEPDHILLVATRADAATGLLDVHRLGQMLARVKGHLVHQPLARISPLALPVLLDIGRVPVSGAAEDAILAEAEALIAEAME